MKKILFTSLFFMLYTVIFSQETEGIPPSPSVASLVTVEKDSVNSTGMIVQSVPLWNMSVGKYTFPIHLTYSSSGIKVEEIPSYVGTGWNLSAGGVITRSVIDLPDDMISSYHGKGILHTDLMNKIKTYESNITNYGYDETTAKNFFKNEVNENIQKDTRNDTQPDVFYFNFFGIQGKFIFNHNKEIVSLSNENYKFSYNLASDNTLLSFTITDTQGIIYTFSEREYSETLSTGNTAWEFLISRSVRKRELNYYSAWHLKSVQIPNNRVINIEYENEIIEYSLRNAVMGKICDTGQCEDLNITDTQDLDVLNQTEGNSTEFVVNSKKIKKISVDDLFEIQFSNTNRDDLKGGKKLSNITIRDVFGNEIQTYGFNYSYLNSPNMPSTGNFEYRRLFLEKIGKNGDCYRNFEYYENYALPHRKSFEQDFWGYYNKNGASSLIPKVYMENTQQPYKYHIFEPLNTSYVTYGQIERSVNENYIHMGMLKKIEYATAGYKEFFYEANEFTHTAYTNSSSPSIKGNGVRLQKIEYFNGTNIETLNYSYTNPNMNISSGKLSYLPKFASHIPWNFVYNISTNFINISSPRSSYSVVVENFYDPELQQNVTCWRYSSSNSELYNYTPSYENQKYFAMTTRRYSLSVLPLATNVENPLAYEYITLKEGNNGEKVYKFNTLGALGDDLPANYDEDNFKNRESYKTYDWYTDDPTPFQTGICFGSQAPPFGSWTLNLVNNYDSYLDLTGSSHPFSPKPNWNRYFGTLQEYAYINEIGFKVFKEEYDYGVKGDFHNSTYNNTSNVPEKIIGLKHRLFSRPWGRGWSFDPVFAGASTQPTIWLWSFEDNFYGIGLAPEKVIRTYYFENEAKEIVTEIDFNYNWGNLLTSESISESTGEKYKTHYRYPISFANNNNTYEKLVNDNIFQTISNFNYRQDNDVSPFKVTNASLTEYKEENGIITSSKTFELERDNYSFNYSWDYPPSTNTHYSTINKDPNLKEKVEYIKHDNYGNLLEFKNEGGINTTLVWGYNQTRPIAKIENATYNEVDLWLDREYDKHLDYIQNLSNNDTNESTENTLRLWLDKLRDAVYSQKEGTEVTTFTYNPLIGVTSITDARGEIAFYEYDNFNRLEHIKNADGKILKSYKYNYKLSCEIDDGTNDPNVECETYTIQVIGHRDDDFYTYSYTNCNGETVSVGDYFGATGSFTTSVCVKKHSGGVTTSGIASATNTGNSCN